MSCVLQGISLSFLEILLMSKVCEKHSIPVMSKTLREHLARYKSKVLKLGFTPKRSFILDACDFILEEGTHGQKRDS